MRARVQITPVVAQLGRQSPTKASRRWALFEDDTVRTINAATNTTLLQSDLRDVDFTSRVTFEFWSRTSTQAAFPVGGEVLAIEAFRTVAGVTTAFNYPIYFRAPPLSTGEVMAWCRHANAQSFIHAPGTPVTYGIRARIDSRTTSSVNCRMYGFRLEWEPIIVTR